MTKVTWVSEKRRRCYRIPATWGPTRATLMQEIESEYIECNCNVCGKPVSSYLSFTDDDGLEVVVGRGCFKRCEEVDG